MLPILQLLLAKMFSGGLTAIRWSVLAKWGAAVAFFLLLVYCYLQHVALKRMELAYKNPAITEQVRIVHVQGPVRIVTRVVETPGRVERETVEERGPVSTVSESLTVKTPIFPPATRSDRWLAGIAINPFDYRDSRSFGVYVGYGFKNRLDLCGGVSHGKPAALVMLRF